jgi:hypothetical protein
MNPQVLSTPATLPLTSAQLRAQMRLRWQSPGNFRAAEILSFKGVGSHDVYNATAPFLVNGRMTIAARVEPRDSQIANIQFFQEVLGEQGAGEWHPVAGAPVFRQTQDPCVTTIGGELIVGGVRYPLDEIHEDGGFQMIFYRGKGLDDLQPFLNGPPNMKDIRLVELKDGRVGVLTRPHFGLGSDGHPILNGTIGFAIADCLEDVTAELILKAPLLRDQVVPGAEKCGGNEAHLLADGRLGVLAHTAYDAADGQHYFATAFVLDPVTLEFTPMQMIASREVFPAGPAKRPSLSDVIFSGGLVRHGGGRATLYCGLSDCEFGRVGIEDPFESLQGNDPVAARSIPL